MTHGLTGKRVVVTRAEGQSAELIARLKEIGAVPIVFPTIEIMPLDDYTALDTALQRLTDYDWIIFTSVNGAQQVMARIAVLDKAPGGFNGCHVAAVGAATAAALREQGIHVDLEPDEYVAESLVAALLKRQPAAGLRILLLRVDTARAVLRDQLLAAGAAVDEVSVYRTTIGRPDAAAYEALRLGADVITFTSSSTVHNFFALLGEQVSILASRAAIACIGPITAQTAREHGLTVAVVAAEYTVRGLLDALAAYPISSTT